MEGLLNLYATDATIESPLIPHLLKKDSGICNGREELRLLIEKVAQHKPFIRKYFKKNFFTDGKRLFLNIQGKLPMVNKWILLR